MKLNVAFQGIIIAVITVFILVYLQSLIMPLIFAVVVWLLIRGVKNHLRMIPVIGAKIPVWLQNVVAFTTIISALVGVGMVLAENINKMIELGPKYTANIQGVLEMANEFFGINILSEAEDYLQNIKITNIATSVFDSLSSFISDIFLVILYVIFLMAEESTIPRKLKYSASSDEKYMKTKEMIAEINESVSHYISLKTVLSLITGVASYIALVFIGVDLPMFWAILIFLLNFIPNIGSLIATAFPALMALLQFAEFTPFLLVILIVGAIQVIVGNVLEPRWMGNSLNISPMVVMLSLAFWGTIWGIVGMFLSVPVTVIIIIVLSKFPESRNIAIWLSGTGRVK